jgi:hypothetical protein
MEHHDSSQGGSGQIDMTIFVKVMTGKREEFIQAIRSIKGDFVKKMHVRKPVLYQKVDDRSAFSLVCELGTQEDLNELLDTEEFKVLLGALTVLCEESDIKYSCVYRNQPPQPCMTPEPKIDEPADNGDVEKLGPDSPAWDN